MLNWFYKQREYVISLMAVFFLFIGSANATTLIKKNTASTFTYQAVKNDGTPLTGLTNITLFYSQHYSTGTFTSLTSFGSPTEMAYGIYNATITAQMANCDYLVIVPTSSTTGYCQYPLKFKTTISDPANLATTDDGSTLNATGGALDTVTTATTATNLTNNNDKTGYSLAAAQEVTVSSFTSAGQNDIQEALTNQGLTTTIGPSVTAIEVDTSAMDTSAELRTLLTGADVAVSTTTPAQIWAYTPTRNLTELDEDNTTIDLNGSTIGTVTTATAATSVTNPVTITSAQYVAITTTTAHIDTSTPQTGDSFVAVNAYLDEAISGIDDNPWNNNLSGNEPTAAGYVITASTRSVSVDTAAIADAVWAEDLTGLNEPVAGGYVISGSTVAGSGATAQQVWEYATRTLTALDEDSTTIDLDNTSVKVSSFTATAQDSIGDNVWKYTLPGTYSGDQAGNLLYLDYNKNDTEF